MIHLAHTALLLAALGPFDGPATHASPTLVSSDRSSPEAPAQVRSIPTPHLQLAAGDFGLHARITGLPDGVLGIVLLSDSPAQTQFLTGLPPILSNYVVLGFGLSKGYEVHVQAENTLPCDLQKVYGQPVAFDGTSIFAGSVVSMLLPPCDADKVPAATDA